MKAKLPNSFSLKSPVDLVRIGRDYDGGYLVSQSDVEQSDLLISLGIWKDWSFEEDFLSRKEVELYAYDASISETFFLMRFLGSLIKVNRPHRQLRLYLSYRRFFSQKKVHHIKKFVGLNTASKSHCTFLEALNATDHKNIFLKVDVEGSEYRFLDDLVAHADRISGLAIEFHDCDIHLKTIEKFINDFGLKLVHAHANNGGHIRSDDGLPLVMELTFSKYADTFTSTRLPHQLDMPNNRKKPEVELVIDH